MSISEANAANLLYPEAALTRLSEQIARTESDLKVFMSKEVSDVELTAYFLNNSYISQLTELEQVNLQKEVSLDLIRFQVPELQFSQRHLHVFYHNLSQILTINPIRLDILPLASEGAEEAGESDVPAQISAQPLKEQALPAAISVLPVYDAQASLLRIFSIESQSFISKHSVSLPKDSALFPISDLSIGVVGGMQSGKPVSNFYVYSIK